MILLWLFSIVRALSFACIASSSACLQHHFVLSRLQQMIFGAILYTKKQLWQKMHEIMSHMEAHCILMQHGRRSGAPVVSSEEANWVCAISDQLKMCLFYVSVLFLYRLLSRKRLKIICAWWQEKNEMVSIQCCFLWLFLHLLSRNWPCWCPSLIALSVSLSEYP